MLLCRQHYLYGGLLLAAMMLLCGCATSAPVQAAPVAAVTNSRDQREGRVYLVRGLLGTFSTGMDDLRDELQAKGVHAITLQHTASRDMAENILSDNSPGPLIIVGHSLGADAAVGMARHLSAGQRPVDLMVTLDPVYPPEVPNNVREAVNFYRSGFALLPLFRGVSLKAESQDAVELRNIDIKHFPLYADGGRNHFNIDENRAVQRQIVELVLARCPQAAKATAFATQTLSLRK